MSFRDHAKRIQLPLVFLLLLVTSMLFGSCKDKSDEANDQAGNPKSLDPRVTEYFENSLSKWTWSYRRDFFWMTPTALASEALRIERTKLVSALGADYRSFLIWASNQEIDPLGVDLVQLAADPFDLYEPVSADKLDLARLYYSLGRESDLKSLVFPANQTESDAAGKATEGSKAEAADPNLLAIWLLYKTQYYGSEEDIHALAKLDTDESELTPEVVYAVRIRLAIDQALLSKPAEDILSYVSPITQSDEELALIIGQILFRSGRLNDAEAVFSNYLRQFDEHPIVWLTRGELYIDMGQPIKGREYLLKGFALNGYIGRSMIGIGTTYKFEARFEEALRHYENCYDTDQLEPSLYPIWASILLELGRESEARDRIDRGLSLAPRNPETRVVSGQIYLQAKDLANAFLEYEEAAKLAPKMPFVHIALGKIALFQGNEAEADASFKSAIELGAPPSEVESVKGRIYLEMEKFDKARIHLLKASELMSDDASIHKDLAKTLETLGDIEGAAVEYAKAGSLNTWDGESCVSAALMYAKLGDVNKSLKWLDNAAAAKWIDTDYIVEKFPDEVKSRPEFTNILSNMNPSFGM